MPARRRPNGSAGSPLRPPDAIRDTRLQVKATSTGPVRASLISKGMLYSPAHGDTAFTVPMFDQFMRRTMPQFP